KDDVVIPALGHDMEGAVVSKEPTCSDEGLMTDKCKRCSRTVTETIPALGHDLDIAVIPATCTEGGFTKSTCKRCNYVEEYNNIPALGHDKKITNAIAPTCVYEGYHLYTCARCGIEDRETLPALGHEYEYTPDGNATCTQDGTRTGKCIRCPKTISDYEPGSALGHSFTLYISNSNATCTDNATEWAACDRGCGTKDVREIPNSALGHEFEGNLCTRCHAVKDEDSSVCKHTYPDNWNVIITPDCQNKGAQVKVCTLCKNIISESLPKTGHIDHNGDSKCDSCDKKIIIVEPQKPEEKPCSCDCHAGGIKAFFFKLINFFAKIFDKNARVCDCGKAH
ncbi:MAG: hypothetical protein II356_00795, partial [Clostridia bacterium]|nr:hypothetical protein [Clostridia bacterium]